MSKHIYILPVAVMCSHIAHKIMIPWKPTWHISYHKIKALHAMAGLKKEIGSAGQSMSTYTALCTPHALLPVWSLSPASLMALKFPLWPKQRFNKAGPLCLLMDIIWHTVCWCFFFRSLWGYGSVVEHTCVYMNTRTHTAQSLSEGYGYLFPYRPLRFRLDNKVKWIYNRGSSPACSQESASVL